MDEMEIEINNSEFEIFRNYIYDICGINLTSTKKQLLSSRLNRRMRELKLNSFRSYREYLTQDRSGQELTKMIDAISTNKTEFFRENAHFEFLKKKVYPSLLSYRKIRIWSAGCSSGEEPYTLAMTILEMLGSSTGRDIKILATDISTKILEEAETGIYHETKMEGIPQALRKNYFLKGSGQWKDHFLVKNELKEMIHFRYLNLMEPFPLSVSFDLIFCRNVMIYFDKPTQAQLIQKFSNQLASGKYFFIGHSESLSGIQTDLQYIQPTVYQKP